MADLTFYTHPFSRGRIVRWMLEEIGVPYDTQVMDFTTTLKAPEFLALNAMGKVPTIKHGDVVVTEVAAICAYLADRFPEKKLAPAPNSPQRGAYYRWLFFTVGPLEMAMTAKMCGWHIDDKYAASVSCGRINDTVNTLANALSNGTYICGDQFTAADVVVSSFIGWEIMQKNLEPLPAFTQYLELTKDRPAALRATQIDDALAAEIK